MAGMNMRVPVEGTLELTYRCNLACVQCYNNLPAGDREALAKELTTEETFRILGEVANAGCLSLLLTGGEVLLRKDFPEIYGEARRLGMLVTIFTNGLGLTEDLTDRLAKNPPHALEITLYGATEETYRRVTGKAGSLARVEAAITRALDRGLPLSLKATLLTENIHELGAMRAMAAARGLAFRYSAELHPRIDRVGSPVETRLTPEQILEADRADPLRWESLRQQFTRSPRSALANSTKDLFVCQAGVSGFHITPYGQLLFCHSIDTLSFDLRQGSFKEGWRRFGEIRHMPSPEGRACNECALNLVCRSCAGYAYLEHGDMTGRVDYLHCLTRLRAEAFGLQVRENDRGALVWADAFCPSDPGKER